MRHEDERDRMVRRQLRRRGIRDERVLDAMGRVPRERFVPTELETSAYADRALPIDRGQTISQPYVVALMIEALEPRPSDRVLEVGAGSGYAAAVLGQLVREVVAIERHAPLADEARRRIEELGYGNVRIVAGDGTLGWPEDAPFDGILVSAGGPEVPPALLEQLAVGGRLVIPVGDGGGTQELLQVTRTDEARYEHRSLGQVQFVPLIGRAGWGGE